MTGKDKLIGTVLILTGLFLVAVGAWTGMQMNGKTVNPYADAGVYSEPQVQEEQPLEQNNVNKELQNEPEVNVYAEDKKDTTIEDDETNQEGEGSTRYIY